MNSCKLLKNKSLCFVLCLVLSLLPGSFLRAQDSTSHRFTTLKLEVRADFDVIGEFRGISGHGIHPRLDDTVHYGFNGRYFNLCLGGEFGKGFSYYFRQRIIANEGASTLFDNTDFLYLQYNFKDRWAVRVGKEALAIGGFEYDAPPIDVLYYSYFWGQVYCFQLAGHLSYTDKEGCNKLTLQAATSPYVHYEGTGSEWKKGLFGYSLMWNGNFPHFQTIYSLNFFERKRGKFVNYIVLGNRLHFGLWSWYIDYQNRAFSLDRHFFDNFSVVSQMNFAVKSFNLFLKGGYDQNWVDEVVIHDPTVEPMDYMMLPGYGRLFYGLGFEYRPAKCPSVRIHAFVNRSVLFPRYDGMETCGTINGNVGLTWQIDFLRYFKRLQEKKQNHNENPQ